MYPKGIAGLFLCAFLLLSSCAWNSGRRSHVERGLASWHAPFFLSGDAQTASGERWWNFKMVAAHRTLPMGTIVKVRNLENNRTAKVRIIDRGPYKDGRIIDVSKRAAGKLDFRKEGLAEVEIEVVDWP